MDIGKLDNEELLRLALDAINRGADTDGLLLLKTLLERDQENVYAHYLLAAQHAQLGLFDRAEQGFRVVVACATDLPIARFQLAQLLILKGEKDEARMLLEPLFLQLDALGAYARALGAIALENTATAIAELEKGLEMAQENHALGNDMQRLFSQITMAGADSEAISQAGSSMIMPMLLTNYQRTGL